MKQKTSAEDPDLKRLCEDLTRCVGSRVRLIPKKTGGRLEIHYHSSRDLERLIGLLRSAGS